MPPATSLIKLPATGWFVALFRSRRFVSVFGLSVILVIGIVDFNEPRQTSPSFFYLLPIMLVTHVAGPRWGVVAALLSTGLWLLGDLTPPTIFTDDWVPCYNALVHIGVFLIVVRLITKMRTLTDSLEQRVAARSAELSRESAERRELEKRILEISEREQARMGQDLHDGLCQHLVGTAFSTNLLHQVLISKGHAEAADVGKIASMLDESISQARLLARGLYPVRIEDLGLATALVDLAQTVQDIFHVECRFAFDEQAIRIDQFAAVHIYRVAQEAVANAAKHALSTLIKIELSVSETEVELRVEDNGSGMRANPETSNGMGLRIMEFRARMIGATFQVDARPGGGTRVRCSLPIPQAPQ